MMGLLKGAILGLLAAVGVIGVLVLLGPSVAPPSEIPATAPQVQQEALASPSESDLSSSETATQTAQADTPVEATVPEQPEARAVAAAPDVAAETPEEVPAAQMPAQTDALAMLPKTESDAAPEALPDMTPETAVPSEPTSVTMAVVEPSLAPETSRASDEIAPETEVARLEEAARPTGMEAQSENATLDDASAPEPRVQSLAEGAETPKAAEENDGVEGQFTAPQTPRALSKRAILQPVPERIGAPVEPQAIGDTVAKLGSKPDSLINRAPNVAVNRLATISEPSTNAVGATDEAATPEQPTEPNALRDYAVAFRASGQPMLSIVVLEGDARDQDATRLAQLKAFDLPIAIALDPTSEGAAERAAAYRAVGVEIVMLSDLPAGARPQDVEVTMAVYRSQLPEAVAVMEAPKSAADASAAQPQDRLMLKQFVEVLDAAGFGLMAESKGLNTSVQLANRAGVPNITIFRNVTPEETQDQLKKIFDRAVFRAAQKGASVVLVPGSDAALNALEAWALVDRPSSVQIAPISAALLGATAP
jgi:polysaccharide deacetylase 2 family uncharacterized protein YibQ